MREEVEGKDGSVGVIGTFNELLDDDDEGEGDERRSNSFAPRVPEGGVESARAVRCGRE